MFALVFTRRRRFAVLLAAGLAAVSQAPASARAPSLPSDNASIVHALERLTFGATQGDIARVKRIGLAVWLDEQLQPSRIDDGALSDRLAKFPTLHLSSAEIARDYIIPARRQRMQRLREAGESTETSALRTPRTEGQDSSPGQTSEAQRNQQRVLLELSQAKILRAVYSERQLEEVLVDFWFNHFNVFAGKGQTRGYITEYEREAIRPHVLGRFRDLLGATAKSPAMLFYLDNWMSSAPDAALTTSAARPLRAPRGTSRAPRTPNIDERTARLASRRSRGLNENYARELLELHTLGVDGGYTQQDIVHVARAFTGWTIEGPERGGFRFVPAMHDAGEKMVLGHAVRSGGLDDGEKVLDIVAAHASTARFIATKLARRFVSDEPPPALVERAATRFRETGGNLREVVRLIVTSPEFFDPAARAAKVKTPLEFVASALRATRANVENAVPLVRVLRDLGMPVYFCQPPTGYDDTLGTWVSSGALVGRMNFALELAGDRFMGSTIQTISPRDLQSLRAALAREVLHDRASPSTLDAMARATTAQQAIALAIGSPEFQRR